MRKGYVFSPLAAEDVDGIWEFIAKENIGAADRVLEEIYAAIHQLVKHPQMGHLREDLADPSHRFWPIRDFLVIYHPDTQPLQIVRVLRGARDIASLL